MRDDEIAQHLQEALKSGELQSAQGFGQPLPEDEAWQAMPESLRMSFKILKNAGHAPAEVGLFRDKAALQVRIAACEDEALRRDLQTQLSQLEQSLSLRLESLRAHAQL